MLKCIIKNKRDILLVLSQVLCIAINCNNIQAAFAWVAALMWTIILLGVEHGYKDIIDKYKRYIRELQKENEELRKSKSC